MAGKNVLAITEENFAQEVINSGKVNVDEQPNLASTFRVMSIPTVTLTKGNTLLMQSIGVKPKETLKREIEAKI